MNQKPKVLRTLTWLAPGGGPDEALRATVAGLSEYFDIHLLTGSVIESDELIHDPRLTVHVCPHMVPNASPIKDLLSIFWIRRFLIKESFDLIHTHETKSSFLVRIANRIARRNTLIYGIHGIVFNDPRSSIVNNLYRFLEKVTLGFADAYTAVSHEIIEIYKKNNLKFSGPIKVLRSAIDSSGFQFENQLHERRAVRSELGIPIDSIVFLNIGRFSLSKNQRDSIIAFAELFANNPGNDLWLMFVGAGDELQKCKNLADEIGIRERIRFVGFEREIQKFFLASDIHLLSSRREGLARVLVEASLAGLPSISYPVEGVREVFPEECLDLITNSFSSTELASKMQTLVSNPDLRKEKGEKFLKKIGTEWDATNIVRKTRDFYVYVLDLGKTSRGGKVYGSNK